jgi:uncharacterized protein HemX
MILTIIILGLLLGLSAYLNIKQRIKIRTKDAQLKQYNHAIHAFEELEGKIGELERYYAKKKTELENARQYQKSNRLKIILLSQMVNI